MFCIYNKLEFGMDAKHFVSVYMGRLTDLCVGNYDLCTTYYDDSRNINKFACFVCVFFSVYQAAVEKHQMRDNG